jgi:redox-sensitive bicupin YhaK (pirin superfamily)
MLEGTVHHEDTTGGQGDLVQGDLQRMFSGDWIEHQELNLTDKKARVIQIWFAADPKHRGLSPHYQQLNNSELPSRMVGDAVVASLIGQDSPMEQHMTGRLTAATVKAGGTTQVEAPHPDEDLFVYVTDGQGQFTAEGQVGDSLGQYDVMLARPDMPKVEVKAGGEGPLYFLSFYLPRFLS